MNLKLRKCRRLAFPSTLLLFLVVVFLAATVTAAITTNATITTSDTASLLINEIMYNPEGDDNDREFIEIYSESLLNLSGYIIGDSSSNDTLVLFQFFPGNYSLIVEEGYNYSNINASVYSAGKTIGNNLNDEDWVYLYSPEGIILDRIAYNSSLGGKNNGNSLEKSNSGEWIESLPAGGTPGIQNSVYNYFSGFHNGSGNGSEIANESFTNESTEGDYSNETEAGPGCDWQIELNLEKFIYDDNFNFSIILSRNNGPAGNITVSGTIEDCSGKIIKNYSPWKNYTVANSVRKKYSPGLAPGVYLINFQIDYLNCEDADKNNNHDSALIAINPEAEKPESSLEIEKIYLTGGKAKWADQFEVKVNIYKGNSSKTSVQLWAEKESKTISRRSKLTVSDKYQYYSVVLPIQLIPNCANEDSADGAAKIILEGLGQKAEQEFLIEGIDSGICKDYSSYLKKAETAQKKLLKTEERQESLAKEENKTGIYQIIEAPAEIIPGEAFRVKVQFFGDKEHEFKVWSYLYRGSKCYSCSGGEKKADYNLIDLKVGEGELKMIELLVKADDNLPEGEYNLMVKVNKDGQKTIHNLNSKVYLKAGNKNILADQIDSTLELLSDRKEISPAEKEIPGDNMQKEKILPKMKGLVVYESNSKIAQKLIPPVLLIAFALLSLILAIGSKNRV